MQVDHLDGKSEHFGVVLHIAETCIELLLLTGHELAASHRIYKVLAKATQDLADLRKENVRAQACP